jgi:type I restriction enzyme S subunit
MIPFPLPPLEEQKAIVTVVETLFKEVEQLEQLTIERITLKEKFVVSALNQLTTNNIKQEWAFLQEHFHSFFNEISNIKKLRETVLQLAVQGKLTADWRANNPDFEDASALLKQSKEKTQLIKIKKIKKRKNLYCHCCKGRNSYELPKGWVWCRFGDLITFLNGYAFKSSTYVPISDYQIIRLGNVKNDNFLINTKEAYVPDGVGEVTRDYQLYEDDILTTLTGTKDRRDYCFTCLVKPEHIYQKVLLLNQRVGCIRAIDKVLLSYNKS